MLSLRNRSDWLKAAVLVVWVAAMPVWLAAQHDMESEREGATSAQQATRERDLAASVHKNLNCADCHGEMEVEIEGRVDPVATCGSCHKQALEAYLPGVHAVAFRRGTPHAPSCVDCHGSHLVKAAADPKSPVSKLRVSDETCARCHESGGLAAMHGWRPGVVADYRQSFHGHAIALGDRRVASCASCHNSHEIRPSRDPLSTVNGANLQQTCGACHVGVAPGFASGGVHHQPELPGHNIVDWARVMYLTMIIVVISLMLLHNGMDFWGRLRERLAPWRGKRNGLNPAGQRSTASAASRDVKSAAPPAAGGNFTYLRFTVGERVQHWTLAASFGLLALTGFALKYTWRIPGLEAQQGALLRGFLHRAAAVTFIALAVYHVGYMMLTRRGRYNLRALVPRVQGVGDLLCRCGACFRLGPPSRADWRDLIQTAKYNLGIVPTRPEMGRFTYAEKMEYLALLWGSAVMIATGLVLWFEVPSLNRFPYWVIDLATAVHYYEAVLATLSIFVWHFYYTIYNPHVFPLSKTMLTGRISREEMERDHALEFRAVEEEQQRKG